jgi:AcrR family transcriptional regulator
MRSSHAGSTKRQVIVERAYDLFNRGGYHAIGIDRIIAESDVAKMTMYRNFPSKEALILAVLDFRARRFEAQLDRLEADASSADHKLKAILAWYEKWFHRNDFHGCLFAHALAEFGEPGHPVFTAVAEQKNDFKDRLTRVLQEMDIASERAAVTATALTMLMEGATVLAHMGQIEEATRAMLEMAPTIVGRALGPA